MDLNHRQQRFVDEYLATGNATQAAIAAGYSERTAASQASDLLRNPKVAAAVETGRARIAERSQVTLDDIEAALVTIAFGDLRDVVEWGSMDSDEGYPVPYVRMKPSGELDDRQAAALAEVRLTARGLAVKQHDRLKALEMLIRMRGGFRDRVEHEIPDAIEVKLSFDAEADSK